MSGSGGRRDHARSMGNSTRGYSRRSHQHLVIFLPQRTASCPANAAAQHLKPHGQTNTKLTFFRGEPNWSQMHKRPMQGNTRCQPRSGQTNTKALTRQPCRTPIDVSKGCTVLPPLLWFIKGTIGARQNEPLAILAGTSVSRLGREV